MKLDKAGKHLRTGKKENYSKIFFKFSFWQFKIYYIQNYCSDISLFKEIVLVISNVLQSSASKQSTKFEVFEHKTRNSLDSSYIAIYIAGMYISCSK